MVAIGLLPMFISIAGGWYDTWDLFCCDFHSEEQSHFSASSGYLINVLWGRVKVTLEIYMGLFLLYMAIKWILKLESSYPSCTSVISPRKIKNPRHSFLPPDWVFIAFAQGCCQGVEPGLLWRRLWPRAAGWSALHGKWTLHRTVPKKLLARTQLWPQRRCWCFLHTSHRYFSHQSSHRWDTGRVHGSGKRTLQRHKKSLQRHKSRSGCSAGSVTDFVLEQRWDLRITDPCFCFPWHRGGTAAHRREGQPRGPPGGLSQRAVGHGLWRWLDGAQHAGGLLAAGI